MILAPLLLALLAQDGARTRDEFVRIEVECTSLAGEDVYLDLGRDAGLEPGDTLRLSMPEGPVRIGKIVSVSRTSARARLADGLEGVDIGTRGVVFVPRTRLAPAAPPPATATEAAPPTAPPAPRVEHPPWTSPPVEWNESAPLLAPAHGVPPEDRPRRFDGRVTTSADWTRDSAGAEARDFTALGLGLEGRVQNPFGRGGQLGFDAEYFARESDTGGESTRDSRLRVDRLSYAWGGVRGARARGEVGRFLQHEFPEFGFLDGIELGRTLEGGGILGASLGYLPEPDDFFRTGNDLQAALFGRLVSGSDERMSLGAGYQKTWHEGVADRDLLAGQFEYHPARSTSLFASTLIDLYTSGDELKGAGPEVTQLFVSATQRTSAGHGLGLFASRLRFPELLRNEFDEVTAEEIADAYNDRLGGDGWLALSKGVQLYGRVERWSDQEDSGGGLRARVTWREALGRASPLLLESYANTGKFTRVLGVRAAGRRRFDGGSLGVSWDATDFAQDDVDEDLLQHALRADLELSLGTSWFLALYAESRFGDEQDALSLGFLLQRSFD